MAQLRASETYRADLEPYTDESRKPQAEIIERVFEVLDAEHGGPLGWLPSRVRPRSRCASGLTGAVRPAPAAVSWRGGAARHDSRAAAIVRTRRSRCASRDR